jgi:hypothetical protein
MKKFIAFFVLFFAAAVWVCAAAGPFGGAADAGQTIVINGDVSHHVFGNGDASRDGFADPSAAWGPPVLPSGDPNANVVTINGGVIDGDVTGGYANIAGGDAVANANVVTINGGEIGGEVYGGRAFASTPNSGNATASGNAVTIIGAARLTNNTASPAVFGGWGSSDSAFAFGFTDLPASVA